MKLANYPVDEFSKILASGAPAPGGGSAAALQGSLGAALLHMVAALTCGKEKYKDSEPLVNEILTKSEKLRAAFIDVMDRDTEAFDGVSAVFSMPKSTGDEKAARSAAMQTALKACTLTPFEMMQLCEQALALVEKAVGKTNASAASDLGVSALSLKAAVQGAWLNILINIGGIKDEDFADHYRAAGEAILSRVLPMADKIYDTVINSL